MCRSLESFCTKDEKKKKHIKNLKIVILSAQLLDLYQKGWGGMTC